MSWKKRYTVYCAVYPRPHVPGWSWRGVSARADVPRRRFVCLHSPWWCVCDVCAPTISDGRECGAVVSSGKQTNRYGSISDGRYPAGTISHKSPARSESLFGLRSVKARRFLCGLTACRVRRRFSSRNVARDRPESRDMISDSGRQNCRYPCSYMYIDRSFVGSHHTRQRLHRRKYDIFGNGGVIPCQTTRLWFFRNPPWMYVPFQKLPTCVVSVRIGKNTNLIGANLKNHQVLTVWIFFKIVQLLLYAHYKYRICIILNLLKWPFRWRIIYMLFQDHTN